MRRLSDMPTRIGVAAADRWSKGDFGITAAQLRERFRFYLDAFDLEED